MPSDDASGLSRDCHPCLWLQSAPFLLHLTDKRNPEHVNVGDIPSKILDVTLLSLPWPTSDEQPLSWPSQGNSYSW